MQNAAHSWLETVILGNSVQAYLNCLLTIVCGLAIMWLAKHFALRAIVRFTRATKTTLDDFFLDSIERYLIPALYALVVYLGLRDLAMSHAVANGLRDVITIFVAVQSVRFFLRIAQELIERQVARRAGAEADVEQEKRSLRGILALVKTVVWVLAFILVLDNLGIKVSTFVAGLGISGIAVALAAQAVLGDLFSYFVIYLDRPFQPGHFIKVGDFMGVVESVGLKTTRLRSLSGELIVMSNKHLTDSQLQNYKEMTRRRVVFVFGVEYKTTEAQLRAIPGVVKELVQSISGTTFDRSHFRDFGDSSLNYESVFYVESPDYNRYMDIMQEINFGLKTRLEGMGIGFPFPTRTIYMAKDESPAK